MKKYLLLFGISLITGFSLSGLNFAYGAPSENPPGNTVSPTFGGINWNNAAGKGIVLSNTGISVDSGVAENSILLKLGTVLKAKGGLEVGSEVGWANLKLFGGKLSVVDSIGNGTFLDTLSLSTNAPASNLKIYATNGDVQIGDGVTAENMTVTGTSQLKQDVTVGTNVTPKPLTVWGDAQLNGATTYIYNANIENLTALKSPQFNDHTTIGTTTSNKNLTVNGNLTVTGSSTLAYLDVSGTSSLDTATLGTTTIGTSSVPKNLIVNGTAQVGTSSLSKNLTVYGDITTANDLVMSVAGSEIRNSAGTEVTINDVLVANGNIKMASAGSEIFNSGGTTVKVNDSLEVTGDIKIPSAGGSIVNTDNKQILETWWTATFGDYTAMNSGYTWGDLPEPVSVVAGRYGVFFTKSDPAGTLYSDIFAKFDPAGTVTFTNGTYASTVGATNRDLYIDSTGKIGYVSSSKRYKDNIKDLLDISWIYKLRPVSFTYKNDKDKNSEYGLIAEEVEHVNKKLVSYNEQGTPETVSYSKLIAPLLKAVQDQKSEIEQLKAENAIMKDALCEMKNSFEFCE